MKLKKLLNKQFKEKYLIMITLQKQMTIFKHKLIEIKYINQYKRCVQIIKMKDQIYHEWKI